MTADNFQRNAEDRRHQPVLFETSLSEPSASRPRDWYTGADFQYHPTSDALAGPNGLEYVLKGWLPEQPLISPTTRVVGLGSCFAAYFLDWLEERGLRQNATYLAHAAMFESVAVLEQQFRWAFGEMDPRNALWIDHNAQRVEATEARRLEMKQALLSCDVLVLTLGMSEVWFDRITNEPLWRTLPAGSYDPERHEVRVLSAADTRAYLESIARLQAAHFPQAKILFTVSPVTLNATFRPISSVTANAASKAIVRAGVDEFFRMNPEGLGSRYYYYPAYELILDVYRRPFLNDNRHPEDEAIGHILAVFAANYTDFGESTGLKSLPALRDAITSDAQQRAMRFELSSSEKEREIRSLSKALDERLQVIEVLDAEVRRLRELMDGRDP